MTVFARRSDARTIGLCAGDVGVVPITLPHYIGDEDLVSLETLRPPRYANASLGELVVALQREPVRPCSDVDDAVPAKP